MLSHFVLPAAVGEPRLEHVMESLAFATRVKLGEYLSLDAILFAGTLRSRSR